MPRWTNSQAETEDRFGHLPDAAQSLFDMGRLRVLSEQAAVKSVDVIEDRLHLRFHENPPIDPVRVMEVVTRQRGTLMPSGAVLLPAPRRGSERIECATALLRLIIDAPAD